MKCKGTIGLLVFLSVYTSGLFSQSIQNDVWASAGNIVELDNTQSMSWTIGEVFIGKFSSNEIISTTGFHQPIEELSTSYFNPEYEIELQAFPNPTSGEISLQSTLDQRLDVEILNVLGQRILAQSMRQSTKLSIHTLDAGVYFLKVTRGPDHLATIAIQKI